MDWMLITGIVAVGLLLAVIVLVMLNRAWGDFPGRISGLPPSQPLSARPTSPVVSPLSAVPPLPDTLDVTPNDGMIPITHPLLRQAVAKALERGGSPYALYFIRDGEAVYLVPSRIANPQQREQLTRLFASLNSGGGEDVPAFGDVIRMMQDLREGQGR
ncbi:MAG: hypothetical protein WCJ55_12340 [Chloroflexales bacterium]